MILHFRSHIYLIISSILFGANYWIAKYTMPTFKPEFVVFLRIIIATIFFLILFGLKQFSLAQPKDIVYMMIAGIFGIALNQFFFFKGIELSSPFEASLLHMLGPILVTALAAIFLSEKITYFKILGILLGFFGAAIIVTSGKEINLKDINFIGNLYILLGVLSYSIFLLMTRKIMQQYQPLIVTMFAFIGGSIAYLPYMLSNCSFFQIVNLHIIDFLALLYVIIAATIVTYLLTVSAMKHLEANVTSYYIFLQPLVAGFIGFAFGLEQFKTTTLLAILLLLSGIWFMLYNGHLKHNRSG